MSTEIELFIDQNADFRDDFVVRNLDGTPIDLTGVTVANAFAKRSYYVTEGVSLGVTVSGNTTGNMTITATSEITSSMKAGQWVWDATVVMPTGNIVRAAQGIVYVSPGVTS